MSKSNSAETNLLELLLNNTPWPNFGDAAGLQGSAVAGNVYLSLHTSDPGEAGNQETGEISYTGYARVAVPRTSGRLAVSGDTVELVNNEDFPEMTAGAGGTVTHFAIGTQASGAGEIIWYGEVDPDILVQNGTIPRLKGQASGTPSSVTED